MGKETMHASLNQPTIRRINGTETRSEQVRFMWRIIFFDVYTWPVGGVFIGRTTFRGIMHGVSTEFHAYFWEQPATIEK